MDLKERIAFYCRTSTGRQEQDETIETQIYKLDEAYKGKNVVDKYLDDGFSGSLLNRPALNRLKQDAKIGKFNVVAIYALDRFSRGGQGKLWFILDYLKEAGVKVEILGKPLEINTPEGTLSTSIIASVAQYEKEKIKQRMVDGKYRKANSGILIGCYPSWGYKLIKKDRDKRAEAYFEINIAEAWKIKKCFEVYRELQCLNQAVKKLAEMGIYARGKKGEEGKYKIPILAGTLKQILQNESYIGNFYFGKKIYCEATRIVKEVSKTRDRGGFTGWKWRPKSEWKLIKIPPIIDEATFNSVQNIIRLRSKNYLRRPKYNYLLQKLVYCIHCGRPYRGKPCGRAFNKIDGTTSRYFRYICYSRHEYKKCSGKGMNARILENTVWTFVKTFISNPENIKRAITEFEKEKDNNKKINTKDLEILLLKKADIKKKKSNFLDLFGDEKFDKQDLYAKIEPLNVEEKLLDKQIAEIRGKIVKIEESGQLDREIKRSCASYYSKIDNPDFELRKRIVRDWVKEINIMDDGRIKIKIRVPEIAGSILNIKDNVYNLLNLNTDKNKSPTQL